MQIGYHESTHIDVLSNEEVLQSEFLTLHGVRLKRIISSGEMAAAVDPLTDEQLETLFEQGMTSGDDPLALWEWMNLHRAALTEARAQKFNFINDATLRLVVQFLRLHSPDLGDLTISPRETKVSLKDLPNLIRSEQLIPAPLLPAVNFITPLTVEQFQPLTMAALALGIPNLCILCGYRLSIHMRDTPDEIVRKQFHVPDKYRDTSIEKLRSLFRDCEWMK